MTENGWSEYKREVLGAIEALRTDVNLLRADIADLRRQEITDLKVQVAMLKVKSGLWGAAAGFVPAAMLAIFEITKGG